MTPNSAIPAIKRLVAIGLRINVSEKFTPSPPLASPSATAASPSAVPYHYFASRREAQLALGNDGLAHRESFVHHHVLFHAAAGHDWPRFHSLIRLDHVHERAGLAGLYGFIGNHYCILLCGEPMRNAHELAGPDLVIAIGEGAFQLDGAGGHIY